MTENNISLKLEQYVQDYAKDPEFIAEGLAIKVVEELLKLLKEKGLSQSWLAEKMEVSRAHISKILNAPPNMTLLTIAKIAVALEAKPDVCLNADFKGSSSILPSKSVDFAWLANDKVNVGEIKASNQFGGTNNGMSDKGTLD
jgi:transcriptional regulator with XRE-family HTH domain